MFQKLENGSGARPAEINFADQYASRMVDGGWRVIPLQPSTKKPGGYANGAWHDLPGWSGHCRRDNTPDEIAQWSRWPGCGLGIALGNVAAIDIDILDDPELAHRIRALAFQMLGETPLERIGQAPKTALFYRAEAPFKKLRAGKVEVLCDGNQVAACGFHPVTGKPYLWPQDHPAQTPVDVLPAITEAQAMAFLDAVRPLLPQASAPLPEPSQDRVSFDPRGTPEAVADALRSIPNSDLPYDEWVLIGLAIKGALGEAGRDLWAAWSEQSVKCRDTGPDSPDAKWKSFKPTNIGAGTIYHMARERGWRPPAELTLSAERAERDKLPNPAQAFLDANQPGKAGASAKLATPLPRGSFTERLVPIGQCSNRKRAPRLVQGLIRRGDVGVIMGQPGAGKSVLAPYLASCIARGADFFGRRTRRGSVIYCHAEDPDGIADRFHLLTQRYPNIDGISLVDVCGLITDAARSDLLNGIAACAPDIVFIDTLGAAWAGLSENDPEAMGSVVAVARAIAATGAAVVLVHHTAKADGSATPRGHGVLDGTLDVSMHLVRDKGGLVTARVLKNRAGPSGEEFSFRIAVQEVGIDEWGQPITAPVCEPAAEAIELVACGKQLTPSAKLAMDVLLELAGVSVDGVVSLESWRAACIDRGVSASPQLKHQNQAFGRVRDALLETGYVLLDAAAVTVKLGPSNDGSAVTPAPDQAARAHATAEAATATRH